jgi:glucan 1,3-beta-glucosidase
MDEHISVCLLNFVASGDISLTL